MIAEKEICTGCFACVNKCPKKCIKMEEDKNGYIYPIIDEEKCIHCNLCKKVCPSINKVTFSFPKKCYAMYSKDDDIRKLSTSGGFATVCSKYIISKGGVVYGVAVKENEKGFINHIRIDNERDIDLLQGSKYVHSYVGDCYYLAKKDLENNKEVLFIGLPCQIAGLRKYLEKEYKNLYAIELVCHGVAPQRYLKEEIKSLTDRKINKIFFRTQEGYKLKLYNNNELIVQKDRDESMYYYGFYNCLFLRENCYQCLYAKPERCADITIGDFWGLDKNAKIYDDLNKGISVVLSITEKGIKLLEQCKNEFYFEERDIQEAINGNGRLKTFSKKPKNYEKIKKYYEKKGYKKMSNLIYKNKEKKEKIDNIKQKLKNSKIIRKILHKNKIFI